MYRLIDEENQVIGLYPPYVHVSLQTPSIIEGVVADMTEDNVDTYLEQLGLPLPPRNPPVTPRAKVDYFMNLYLFVLLFSHLLF